MTSFQLPKALPEEVYNTAVEQLKNLPESLVAREFAVPGPSDYVFDEGEIRNFSACGKPYWIVDPAPGYSFQYDIFTDRFLAAKTA